MLPEPATWASERCAGQPLDSVSGGTKTLLAPSISGRPLVFWCARESRMSLGGAPRECACARLMGARSASSCVRIEISSARSLTQPAPVFELRALILSRLKG